MKLAILSRAPHSYSTGRLRSAAEQRGHRVKVLNTLRFAVDLTGPEPDLNYRGKPLSTYDAILPRIGNSITYFGTAVVRQFEQMDVFTPNTSNGISNARDKLRATQILSRHGIGMPATAFVRNRADCAPRDRARGRDPPSSSSSSRARRASASSSPPRPRSPRRSSRRCTRRTRTCSSSSSSRRAAAATSEPSSSATASSPRCAEPRRATSSARTCTAAARS